MKVENSIKDYVENKYRLKLNLQHHAEPNPGDPPADPPTDPPPGDPPADPPSDPKSFSQEDVNKIISDRLAKEKNKWEKDFETKLNDAKTEAEKLAKMNAEQKAEYEKKKHEDALAKREGEITRRELRATALESLAEKGLPKTLADILDYKDADSTSKSIETVEKAFRDAVEAAVNERLKGTPPKGGGGGANSVADQISKIFAQR